MTLMLLRKELAMTENFDKAVPGAVVGTVVGGAISPILPVMAVGAVVGGLISYFAIDKEQK